MADRFLVGISRKAPRIHFHVVGTVSTDELYHEVFRMDSWTDGTAAERGLAGEFDKAEADLVLAAVTEIWEGANWQPLFEAPWIMSAMP